MKWIIVGWIYSVVVSMGTWWAGGDEVVGSAIFAGSIGLFVAILGWQGKSITAASILVSHLSAVTLVLLVPDLVPTLVDFLVGYKISEIGTFIGQNVRNPGLVLVTSLSYVSVSVSLLVGGLFGALWDGLRELWARTRDDS